MYLLTMVEIWALVFTCVFILFDVLTGVAVGFLKTGLSSAKSRKGVQHKVGLILAMVLGVLLHVCQQFFDLGIRIPILVFICLYITFTEIISICENIGELSPQLKDSRFMKLFQFAVDGKDNLADDGEEAHHGA